LAQNIGPNRALRSEAETLIQTWRAQREQPSEQGPAAPSDPAASDRPATSETSADAPSPGTADQTPRTEPIDNSQPLWDQAQAQAAAGDYLGAIALANRIRSDSPLYRPAQQAIASWLAARSANGSASTSAPTPRP
jgi:hypothetical protein